MPTVFFRGTVRPPIFKLNVDRMPMIRFGWPDGNLTADFTITIKDSKVEVRCDVTRFDKEEHLSMLAMHANDLSSAAIDSFCFFYGFGLRVFLEIFIDADGNQTALTAKTEEVAGLCKAFNLDPSHVGPDNFEAMIRLVVKERPLLLALNDLIVPISQFNLATINCARAIEGLRAAMSSPEWSREKQWEFMRSQLNISKEYLGFVIGLSADPRHGKRKAPEVGEQAEVIRRAWVVMDRFLEFRKRNNQQLPTDDFPPL